MAPHCMPDLTVYSYAACVASQPCTVLLCSHGSLAFRLRLLTLRTRTQSCLPSFYQSISINLRFGLYCRADVANRPTNAASCIGHLPPIILRPFVFDACNSPHTSVVNRSDCRGHITVLQDRWQRMVQDKRGGTVPLWASTQGLYTCSVVSRSYTSPVCGHRSQGVRLSRRTAPRTTTRHRASVLGLPHPVDHPAQA